MGLRAGILKHKVTIQRVTATLDSANSIENTWSSLRVTRASINPIKGTESFINQNMINQVTHYIKMRKTDITPEDRIIFEGKIFDIESVLNVNERGTELMILANKILSENIVFTRSDLLLEQGGSLLTETGNILINEGIV